MSLVSIAPAEAVFFVLVVIGERLLVKVAGLTLIFGVANRKLTNWKQFHYFYTQSKVFNRHLI